jgi:MoaA/NifB/PqqE/SkfB family radical SAM enzyme
MLTERCNARCIHCNIWQNRGGEPTPELHRWKEVLRELAAWLGSAHVCVSGGEALLRPYTPELLAFGKQRGLMMELLTHGYWLDQSRIEAAALSNPWRVTVSVDGIGAMHNTVRGRSDFWTHTERSLQTLGRLRHERQLTYSVRLKTVIMRQNLNDVFQVAEFAAANGFEVFYQPIEQNYNTPDDPTWYRHGSNWPTDSDAAISVIDRLIDGLRRGLPIRNSVQQLEVMKTYFANPDGMMAAVQSHTAHEGQTVCSAATTLQIQANGDAVTCFRRAPAGNISELGIREIWTSRPRYWVKGCCQRQPAGDASPLTVIS